MNTYTESKKVLDKIRADFGCKGDVIFRTAIQEIIGCGQTTFLDDSVYEDMLNDIDAKHDHAEANDRILFMARDFEKAIVKCARELAAINTYDLIIYMQKEVCWSNEGGIDYGRLYQITGDVMEWMVSGSSDSGEDYKIFNKYCSIDDDELEELGFGYMIPEEDKEND